MRTPDRHCLGAPQAELEWQENGTPVSKYFGDVYYSRSNGLEESRHVFLAGNRLPESWRDKPSFAIGETGFGTGLNFLLTWHTWRSDPQRSRALHYLAFEKYPLSHPDLARCLASWPALREPAAALLTAWPPPLPGHHRLVFEAGRVVLDLLIGDILDSLQGLSEASARQVNAWYLDGFAPSSNSAMWQEPVFRGIARWSAPGATLATYTAAGQVRRDLEAAGFAMQKAAGYGSKREMLRGTLNAPGLHAVPDRQTPWHIAATPRRTDRALVLGGGLAGASVAAALAHRGWRVQVLERGRAAEAASGNAQGVLYTRVSHQVSDLNSFALHSYLFALRCYRSMFDNGSLGAEGDGEFCGALHLAEAPAPSSPLAATLASLPGLARYVPPEEAAQLSGLQGCPGGIHFPGAGWLSPPAVCRAHLATNGVRLQEQCGELRLERDQQEWVARDPAGQVIGRAPVAVLATGTGCSAQPGLDWLPLQAIRGQVTQLPSHGPLSNLVTVICHDGYIAPARNGEHCIGASFDPGDPDTAIRHQDHAHNIQRLQEALPMLGELPTTEPLAGRAALRCASPDYLPLAGPVPDRDAFIKDYEPLRRNARQVLEQRGSYLDGLFISTAHGSRGLTSTPLAAELLACLIAGEPAPLEDRLLRALSPARFLVRDLTRNRL